MKGKLIIGNKSWDISDEDCKLMFEIGGSKDPLDEIMSILNSFR